MNLHRWSASSQETRGPISLCVLARLIIIIFCAAGGCRSPLTHPSPSVSPLPESVELPAELVCNELGQQCPAGWSAGPAPFLVKLQDSVRRAFWLERRLATASFSNSVRAVKPPPRLTLLLASVGPPLLCLNFSCSVSASWHSRKPLSRRSMKLSAVISRPARRTHQEGEGGEGEEWEKQTIVTHSKESKRRNGDFQTF